MPQITDIVLASRNKHKIEEMQAILSPHGINLLSALDFPALEEVVEDEQTLEGNALKKARYVHLATRLPALSDDTGLEVEALGGRPGVFSARYAGEKATYSENVTRLLQELDGVWNRKACFRTVIAFEADEITKTFDGICEGEILEEIKGSGGFGYDPVFKPAGFNQTFAELEPSVKNEISHRGRAVKKFIEFLQANKYPVNK